MNEPIGPGVTDRATSPVGPAAGHHGGGRDATFTVTIRTLAGHSTHERVHAADTVAALTTRAVSYFVARHELTVGDYALTVARLGTTANLDPTGTLAEVGVRAGDVLVLINRAPQVDG
ncbi:hypothetical protein [Pseudonocardia sp. 73-21]|uniref:hypothetical protein n=1 Tax=Pseudonocardia sp. 73-21 TaxID=1895809 RepID=UPI00260F58E8|nr:hypothetical protein [Pseudonocardia sp. 73-21]